MYKVNRNKDSTISCGASPVEHLLWSWCTAHHQIRQSCLGSHIAGCHVISNPRHGGCDYWFFLAVSSLQHVDRCVIHPKIGCVIQTARDRGMISSVISGAFMTCNVRATGLIVLTALVQEPERMFSITLIFSCFKLTTNKVVNVIQISDNITLKSWILFMDVLSVKSRRVSCRREHKAVSNQILLWCFTNTFYVVSDRKDKSPIWSNSTSEVTGL